MQILFHHSLPPPPLAHALLVTTDYHHYSVRTTGICRHYWMIVGLSCHLVVADLHRLAGHLSAFIVVTNSDAALAAEALGPEALNGWCPRER